MGEVRQARSDPAPARALRAALAAAKHAGEDFESAWPSALAAVGASAGDEWARVLTETRSEWKAAYYGDPPVGRPIALAA